MTGFKDYLLRRRDLKTPAGAFTRLTRDDPEIQAVESWPQLPAYVYRKVHADKVEEAIQAAEPVWKGYRGSVLKHRRKVASGQND